MKSKFIVDPANKLTYAIITAHNAVLLVFPETGKLRPQDIPHEVPQSHLTELHYMINKKPEVLKMISMTFAIGYFGNFQTWQKYLEGSKLHYPKEFTKSEILGLQAAFEKGSQLFLDRIN